MIDVDALAKAAHEDTEMRLKMLEGPEHLGIAAMLNAAFLTGWRFAMQHSSGDEKHG